MLRERNETYMLLFAVVDTAMAFVSFWMAYLLRFLIQGMTVPGFDFVNLDGYFFISIVIAVSQAIVFYFMDMYRPGKIGLFIHEFTTVIRGTVVTIFIVLGVIFFLKTYRYSRLAVFYFGIINIFMVSLGRMILRRCINRVHAKGKRLETLVIIGTGKSAEHIASIMAENSLYGFVVAGFISLKGERGTDVDPAKILGTLDDLPRILVKTRPYHVIFASELMDRQNLDDAFHMCSFEGIRLHVVPSFSELLSSHGRLESVEGIPLISLRDIPARRGFNRFIKRAFDIVFSLVFIIVFSPLYLLVAILVKITSRGPVLFRQERVGLNNKVFKLLKFRTMYVQQPEDSDKIWTKDRDPRVTPIGRILRKTSLDEFPQFFNVLAGSMSVVGPRPERPFWVEQFKERYKGYMQRHGMKAGITGWAQINGLRGDTSIEERVAADIYYIDNWSFLFDLKIIFLTPFKSIMDRNAY